MPPTFADLDSIEKLDDLFSRSHDGPVVIFKHSATCNVSSLISRRINELDSEINIIVVQKNRDVSNALAERTGIRHETPQAIVLRNGEAAYHASHYAITAEILAGEIGT